MSLNLQHCPPGAAVGSAVAEEEWTEVSCDADSTLEPAEILRLLGRPLEQIEDEQAVVAAAYAELYDQRGGTVETSDQGIETRDRIEEEGKTGEECEGGGVGSAGGGAEACLSVRRQEKGNLAVHDRFPRTD